MTVSKCCGSNIDYNDGKIFSNCQNMCEELDRLMPYGNALMQENLVEIPIEELTHE